MAFTPTTWNPLDKDSGGGTLSGGNLTYSGGTGGVRSAVGVTSGKFYWEIEFPSGEFNQRVGVATSASDLDGAPGNDAYAWAMDIGTGDIYSGGVVVDSSTIGTPYGFISVLLDATAKELRYRINDIDVGVVVSLTGTQFFAVVGSAGETLANFGDAPFAYAPPAGYQAGLGAFDATGETISPAGVLATKAGAPLLKLGYPATVTVSGAKAVMAGAPTLLAYSDRLILPQGALAVRSGRPIAINELVPTGTRFILAEGGLATKAGAPALTSTATITASGVLATKAGTPTAAPTIRPAGMLVTNAGAPKFLVAVGVSGSLATKAGAPSIRGGVHVPGSLVAHAGTPKASAAGMVIQVAGRFVTLAGTPGAPNATIRPLGSVHVRGGTPKAARGMRC